jgi:hypothetical protein
MLTVPHSPGLELQTEGDLLNALRMRRSRTVRYKPDREIQLKLGEGQRDLTIFLTLQTHYVLPTDYLYEFTKHICRDYVGLRERLRLLWLHGYLERVELLNHPLVFSDKIIYALSDKTRKLLATIGKLNRYAPPSPSGGYRHAFMTCVFLANADLWARSHGYQFISLEEILAEAPPKTRDAKDPLGIPCEIVRGTQHAKSKTKAPDWIYGIDYGNGVRFFLLETDRGSEPMTRADINEPSIERHLLAYKNIGINGTARRHFGVDGPDFYPQFLTTSAQRCNNILEVARKIYPNGSYFTLFGYVEGFSPYYQAPPLLPHLFEQPWQRAHKDPLLISK